MEIATEPEFEEGTTYWELLKHDTWSHIPYIIGSFVFGILDVILPVTFYFGTAIGIFASGILGYAAIVGNTLTPDEMANFTIAMHQIANVYYVYAISPFYMVCKHMLSRLELTPPEQYIDEKYYVFLKKIEAEIIKNKKVTEEKQ